MKKIVCELCEGTEFAKEGRMFICQGCGTKYTPDEAKAMMKEVEGDSAVVGAPTVNPNQQQIENFLILASTALEVNNIQEAENYCNKAIELDTNYHKAWILKAKIVGWSSTLEKLRIEEAAHLFCKAIDFAPEDERDSIYHQVYKEMGKICLALVKKSMSITMASAEPAVEVCNVVIPILNTIIDVEDVFCELEDIDDEEKELEISYLKQMNTIEYETGIEIFKNAYDDYVVASPNRIIFDEYKKKIGGSIILIKLSLFDEDDEVLLERYKKIQCIAYSVPSNYYGSQELIKLVNLTFTEAEPLANLIKVLEMKVETKKEEEKQARIKAYWKAHPKEKAKIEEELKGLNDKKSKLSADIASVEAEIQALQSNGVVPSEAEDNKIKDQIKFLENDRAKLGLFAGKQKKQINEEIAALNDRRDSLTAKIEAEKKARQAEADKKMTPLKEKESALRADLDKTTKKIVALETELTKDPE